MTKVPFDLTIHLPTEGLDEGSDVDLFVLSKKVNTKENPYLFYTTPATNIQ